MKQNQLACFPCLSGLEHGVGVYVSQVIPNSAAERQGLRVGDEIVRINGFPVALAVHAEVLSLVAAANTIQLKVRSKFNGTSVK